MNERQKFDAWCERKRYYRNGKRITERRYGRDQLVTSFPPRDTDLAWEAWQEALRTRGVPGLAGLAAWLREQAKHPCATEENAKQWTAWAAAVDAACGVPVLPNDQQECR